jgi:hypothetical protein
MGAFFYKNGNRYEGQWQDNQKHGKGTMFYASGDVYVGTWVNGHRHGFGTYTTESGDAYEGQWVNDKREGPGLYYYRQKERIYDGEWVNDIAKCGIYLDAADFFQQLEAKTNQKLPQSSSSTMLLDQMKTDCRGLPELQVANPESILAKRISEIHMKRAADASAEVDAVTDTNAQAEEEQYS